jgi:Pyridine nucleotide-disulphide oxidoreductase
MEERSIDHTIQYKTISCVISPLIFLLNNVFMVKLLMHTSSFTDTSFFTSSLLFPSLYCPLGSKWGLGGTCVNVGCIPKKLFHTAALMGETAHEATYYGWSRPSPSDQSPHSWEALREHVQDHIKGLNFGYRVQLRELGVSYQNKLAKFIDPHTLECTDAKGKKTKLTARRIIIAVGGRPSPLQCPGGEYAITSDDLFMKEDKPGKTLVVGAGYVALECAGFINGLKQVCVCVCVCELQYGCLELSVRHILCSKSLANSRISCPVV